ncbi:hypothetical protein DFR67_11122 [Williamsia limnetica]|uniref:DUF8021 domain-containing protein n=1 Tax=Williamsia limnetica TaxID=882452 RepID=A0A318REW5_WILLI|nr:hypothetical protein [Williamsia limnetica]PYE14948.1 hypothetical protein DFR67_11122 [Williamsia limnetica]
MKLSGSRLFACALLAGAALCLTPALCLIPSTAAAAPAATCTPAQQLAGAETYVAALADPSFAYEVPVATDVVRFENGVQTGFSGDVMKAELAAHLQYGGITAINNQQWTGAGNLVRAVYDLEYGVGDVNIADSTIDETFAFNPACDIQRIDATFSVRPGSAVTGGN